MSKDQAIQQFTIEGPEGDQKVLYKGAHFVRWLGDAEEGEIFRNYLEDFTESHGLGGAAVMRLRGLFELLMVSEAAGAHGATWRSVELGSTLGSSPSGELQQEELSDESD